MKQMQPDTEQVPAPCILVVDDDQIMRIPIEDRLKMEGFDVVAAADLTTARQILATQNVDLVVTDIRLPDGDGRDLFREVSQAHPGTPVIVMTGYISVEDAVALTKAGAVDYLTKPFDLDDFVMKARRAIDRARDLSAAPLVSLDGSKGLPGSGLLGRSPAMRRIEAIAARIRDVDSSILLSGESGVGKEVVAKFIHQNSARADGPFIAVNIAAMQADQVDEKLFGVESGYLVGTDEGYVGRFAQAQGGTIFLDEIADVSAETQVKLLRVLQEHKIEPLGAAKPVQLDVRVIAATQSDIEADVREGRFRTDLFWRLNVLSIEVPPLRERREDILFLARRFVAEQSKKMGRPVEGLSAASEKALMQMQFPGNVRELKNLTERAVALSSGPRIQEFDLNTNEFTGEKYERANDVQLNLKANVETAERAAIVRAISKSNSVLHLAAEHLGISRKTLWEKMRRYAIEK